jgi:CheY-like chemotaxis protein
MSPRIYVKVVGFRDMERHALNTLFMLSAGRPMAYVLWTPESPMAPHLTLFDLEAAPTGLAGIAPDLAVAQKMIFIGPDAPAQAWRSFERPLQWLEVVAAMDSLFEPPEKRHADLDLDFSDFDQTIRILPAYKQLLLVDPLRQDRLYLRARLALAGHAHADDAETAEQALRLCQKQHYDVVVVALELPDMAGWELVRQLLKLEPAMGRIIVTTSPRSRESVDNAVHAGCFGLLEKPFDPLQVVELLQKI